MVKGLVPLCSRPEGKICVAGSRLPAVGASAWVYTRRKGERVPAVVYADGDGASRLRQPLTVGRHGPPGFVFGRQHLEVDAEFRGRTVNSLKQSEARARAAQDAHTAETDAAAAHERRDAARAAAARAAAIARAQTWRAEKTARRQAPARGQNGVSAHLGQPLMITIDDGKGNVVEISQRAFSPSFDARLGMEILAVTPGFGMSGGSAYYDTGGPTEGEAVTLGVSQTLDLVLVR